eukprot:TRINITY_DN4897_c0_g1_i1.p1 TRINITY_DN4897_c0_g1~~TRINITY_DN4897_c0_g1_i1.p1  ORF type:complete len:911 (-),score=282.99 TRINITY_DN4897_c0_g1_i1:51-2708(-)
MPHTQQLLNRVQAMLDEPREATAPSLTAPGKGEARPTPGGQVGQVGAEAQEKEKQAVAERTKPHQDKAANGKAATEEAANEEAARMAQEMLQERGASQQGLVELGARAQQSLSGDPAILKRDGILDVYVVAHTHCDPGWLSTMEEYYRKDVKHILDTVVVALEKNPSRRFSWVEVSFLERWWRDQGESMRQRFRALVKSGQIELLMGGWVSSDEACTSYMQVVSQMSEGHRWLEREVVRDAKDRPRIGWQIDPFGLSRVYPSLFSQMCFDSHTAWRISEPEMKAYMPAHEVEFVWRGSESIGAASDILMHLLPWGYEAPQEFLFEANSGKKTMQSPKNGARMLANNFLDRSKSYESSNVLMWPWGHDFRFKDANVMFDSMDRLFAIINANPEEYGVRVRYATPSEYFDALHSEGISFPSKSKDFFPYWAGPVNWWTGYYTSRPTFKRRLRETDNLQKCAESAFVLARAQSGEGGDVEWDGMFDALEKLRHVQGVMQHHDAITGTMKEAVLTDYHNMLDGAVPPVHTVLAQSLAMLLDAQWAATPAHVAHDEEVEVGSAFALFNPLAWHSDRFFCVRVRSAAAVVVDAAGARPDQQLMPVWEEHGKVLSEPHAGVYRLYFRASLAPLGTHVFFTEAGEQEAEVSVYAPGMDGKARTGLQADGFLVRGAGDGPPEVSNGVVQVQHDEHGVMQAVVDLASGHVTRLRHSYWTWVGDPKWSNQYTFTNKGGPSQLVDYGTMRVVAGPFVQEVTGASSGIAVQTVRLFAGSGTPEVVDRVGPPPRGVEMVSRYDTDVVNGGHFFTDDNGLETVCRQLNTEDSRVKPCGNYYPSVYAAGLMERCDGEPRVVFAHDRPHGVTSLEEGQLEVMLHRSALQALGTLLALSTQTH